MYQHDVYHSSEMIVIVTGAHCPMDGSANDATFINIDAPLIFRIVDGILRIGTAIFQNQTGIIKNQTGVIRNQTGLIGNQTAVI